MKKRILSLLVLLITAVTGAVAQTTYKVSVKEGTEDANKWEIAPAEATTTGVAASTAVSAKYSGTKMVKSVKAVKKAAKTDLLSGVFSVSASKKVNFSKGNLRYASSKWSFFDNQYDYYTSYSAGAWDKFGWSTSATTYGMNTSTDNATYSGDFVDWGATMGTGWFTLSSDEWTYLLNTRTASIVGGTTDGRYAKAKVNDVQGIILFPDTYTHPDGVTAPTGVNATDVTGWNGNDYSSADWTKMESAGCVFLPAAGYRGQASVKGAGSYGYYWSSSPYTSDAYRAYLAFFSSGTLNPASYSYRNVGYSVRLVQATSDAAPATPTTTDLSTITENYEAKNGETLTGTLTNNVKISIADGATVTLKDVTITNLGDDCDWAGINCPGDATLVLEGTNEVCAGKGDYGFINYPGIWIAPNKTLTIQGAGNLTAYSGGPYPDYPYGAGIGGGFKIACGNIVINSGNITATGGEDAAGIGAGGGTVSCGNITINGGTVEATGGGNGAGIGGGYGNACGNITISGGTVSATGGDSAAGIGGGSMNGVCGNITIKSTVTSVTATKGGQYAPYSIGRGYNGTAITVTIGGVEGAITTSPYTYDPTAQATPALSITSPSVGQVIGSDGKNYAYGSLPTGVTAVAKICYVSGSNGLALALTDEESNMDWSTAIETCAAHTPAFTGGTWKLASLDEWENMITTAGNQTDLRDGFSSVGGTNMQLDCYWSSSEVDSESACLYYFGNGQGYSNDDYKDAGYYVRACLAFTYTPVTVTWNSPNFNGNTYTQDGVTLTPSNDESTLDNNFYDYGANTFTTTLGKFTKIEIVCTSGDIDGWTKETAGKYQPYPDIEPDNWKDLYKLTWTGDAESVTIQEDVYGIQSITFNIQ